MKLLQDVIFESNGIITVIPKGSIIREQTITKPKPTTEPSIKPSTKPPQTPKRDPFKPPKPAFDPRPKAKKPKVKKPEEDVVEEAYEDEASESVRKYWDTIRRSRHLFGKHPIMARHGQELSRSGFKDVEKYDPDVGFSHLNKIMRLEDRHAEELTELAKDIVVQIWGVPREYLHAELGVGHFQEEGEPGIPFDDPEEEEFNARDISPELRKQINKRITMNAMTHGSAVHQMKTVHYLIDKRLNEIDPDLVKMYSELSGGSHKMYWMMDMFEGNRAGTAKVDWSENGDPIVFGVGLTFPVLVQELSKGVMELLTMHGYSSLKPEDQKKVRYFSDRLEDEPYLMHTGPELWRRFLKSVPRGINLSELIAEFSILDPDEVHEIIDDVIQNPESAKRKLNNLINKEERWSEESEENDEEGEEVEEGEEDTYSF